LCQSIGEKLSETTFGGCFLVVESTQIDGLSSVSHDIDRRKRPLNTFQNKNSIKFLNSVLSTYRFFLHIVLRHKENKDTRPSLCLPLKNFQICKVHNTLNFRFQYKFHFFIEFSTYTRILPCFLKTNNENAFGSRPELVFLAFQVKHQLI
jgi:hypothetical protein